jgi:hypothetical protein
MFSQFRIGQLFSQLMILSFVIIGIYNAIVINTESEIATDQMKFVKRLDEMYGVETPGRMVAASTSWKKISRSEIKKDPIRQVVTRLDSSIEKESESKSISSAAVQEELSMILTEVINPKKWQTALNKSDFSGNLSTRDGLIENLNVSLPDSTPISISFIEMNGNVFEYDFENEIYSGMIYQVDKSSYMVTLTNGPLEGTRLKFMSIEEDQNEKNMEIPFNDEENDPKVSQMTAGNFGDEVDPNFQADEISRYDREIQKQAQEAQTFNF